MTVPLNDLRQSASGTSKDGSGRLTRGQASSTGGSANRERWTCGRVWPTAFPSRSTALPRRPPRVGTWWRAAS